MKYQNLIDFSVCPSDVNRFSDGWEGLSKYVDQEGVDGVELLIGYQRPEEEIPREIVKSVHLPFWVTWLEVWRNGMKGVNGYFPEVAPEYLKYCCGGSNASDMVATLHSLWDNASQFDPFCAVMHAAHVELEHSFSRKYCYTDAEVCGAFASLINQTAMEFPNGEPPCTIGIENLWWPGLNFINPLQVDDFAGELEFDNWVFVLDTGHLMNTNNNLRCEDEAIDYVLERIDKLSVAVRSRIRSLHLNLSLSGDYQSKALMRSLPADWVQLGHGERYETARNHVLKIDQHRPFEDGRAREIIQYLQPDCVVHEFITHTMEEFSLKLKTQMGILS